MAYSFVSQGIALAKLLRLDRPHLSSASDPDSSDVRVQNEHGRRVWWTSYCLDRMLSTDLGLEPAHLTEPDLPSSAGLVGIELEEFFDPRPLISHAQLSEIKRRVVEAASTKRLRAAADEGERRRIILPCLDTLRAWRESLGPGMAFEFPDGIPDEMMALPFTRVLSSLYLRYHQVSELLQNWVPIRLTQQCFILLLRPFYFQELASIAHGRGNLTTFSGSESRVPPPIQIFDDDALSMKADCLQAARNNCKILLDLCKHGKIGTYHGTPPFSLLFQ